MREILFRGKQKENGEWIYGGIYSNNDEYFIINDSLPVNELGSVCNGVPINPETVGQYTGLKDKNGKMIFDGDIIRYTTHSGYLMKSFDGAIIWDNEYACFGITMPDLVFPMHLCNIDCIEDDFIKHCEVIGNIHNNPELIKL